MSVSMDDRISYASEEDLGDIVGTYLPGDFDDYDVSVEGVTERHRESDKPTEQVVTYELETEMGEGSMFTITWQEGERQDLVFEDDPVEYLEE